MKQSRGFTLVECMIYISISSFLAVLVLQAYMALQKTLFHRLASTHEQISLAVGIDVLQQDIARAPIDLKRWSSRGPQLIRWHDDLGNEVGFGFMKNKLLKITRSRSRNGPLKGAAYSVLSSNISGSFKLIENRNHVQSVHIEVTTLENDKQRNFSMIMCPKEGIIHA